MVSEPDEETTGAFRTMLDTDPPAHTRLRRLVNRGFTPRMVTRFEEHYAQLTAELLAKAVAQGTFDFVTDVAAELPLMAIAELLGVPVEDRHKLFDWSNKLVGNSDPEYVGSARRRRSPRPPSCTCTSTSWASSAGPTRATTSSPSSSPRWRATPSAPTSSRPSACC